MKIQRNNIDKTLKYYELLMVKDLNNIDEYSIPDTYKFVFWDNDNCIDDWIKIHLETGEFNSIQKAKETFHIFYDKFYNELSFRCLFIVNSKGEKVATATISPANEYGYKCVIDWFAISPKAQGVGLSKPLLSKVLLIAKNLNYKKILLHTQTHTWLAANVYLDCGFTPFKTRGNKGWDILNTITKHPKLNRFKILKDEEIYDNLVVSIKEELDKLHSQYNYSVWYKDGRNDVYVREGVNYFEYKYELSNNRVTLIRQK